MGVRGIVVALTLLALALPAAAGAQVVPPGNSGVDQYQESIPGVGGNRPTGPNGSGTGNASGQRRTALLGWIAGLAQHRRKASTSSGRTGRAPPPPRPRRLPAPRKVRGARIPPETPAPAWVGPCRSSSRSLWRAPSAVVLIALARGNTPGRRVRRHSRLMAGGRVGRVAVLAACGLLAVLAHPAAAPAKHGLVTGFVDTGLYASARSGRTCHLAGPDGGLKGRDRAPRCHLGDRRGISADLPIPRTPPAPPTTSRRSTRRCATPKPAASPCC